MTVHVPLGLLYVVLAAFGVYALLFGGPLGPTRYLFMGAGGSAAGQLLGGGWALLGLLFAGLMVLAFIDAVAGPRS